MISSASIIRGTIPLVASRSAYHSYNALVYLSVYVVHVYNERGLVNMSGNESFCARSIDGNIRIGCRIWKMGCRDRRRLSGTEVGFVCGKEEEEGEALRWWMVRAGGLSLG